MKNIILYGISNCDTVRKARKWLEEHGIAYDFHDYRKDGIDADLLHELLLLVDLRSLINSRSATWRQMDEATREILVEEQLEKAIPIIIEAPTVLRRPLLVGDHGALIGFKEDEYRKYFDQE